MHMFSHISVKYCYAKFCKMVKRYSAITSCKFSSLLVFLAFVVVVVVVVVVVIMIINISIELSYGKKKTNKQAIELQRYKVKRKQHNGRPNTTAKTNYCGYCLLGRRSYYTTVLYIRP